MYSVWKYRSTSGTFIAVFLAPSLPLLAIALLEADSMPALSSFFTILVLWQMPHFYAIAMFRYEDYAAASIPVLPVVKGMHTTKLYMLGYILAFIVSTGMLLVFGYTGYAYLAVAALTGLAWLCLCIKGFRVKDDQVWARQMFRLSLVIIMALSLMISVDTVH